jgi:two-component system, chemotaxis family, sensor kinase CheA
MAADTFHRNPEDVSDFISESLSYLEESEPVLASIRDGLAQPTKENIDSFFRVFHSIKGVAGFLHFNQIQSVTHRSEEILDDSRTGKMVLNADLADLLLRSVDVLKSLVEQIKNTGNDDAIHPQTADLIVALEAQSSRTRAFPKQVANVKIIETGGLVFSCFLNRELLQSLFLESKQLLMEMEGSLLDLLDKPLDPKSFTRLNDGLSRLRFNYGFIGYNAITELCEGMQLHIDRRMKDSIPIERMDVTLFSKVLASLSLICENSDSVPEVDRRKWIVELTAPLKTIAQVDKLPNTPIPIESASHATPAKNAANQEMRVGLDKLDQLVELIEELGVVAVGVSQSQSTGESISRMLESRLLQVTESLQELSIAVRQVPAGNILRKLVRVVGDVSKKLGKKVDLKIQGEDVEMDREVLEALQDPLVHVVRNALDHGIELPDHRLNHGKKETGSLMIEAWHGNGEFCLSVVDDGRGIDRKKILAKGLEKGLITAEAKDWPDSKILGILFMPGFSTNEVVTEFSGRGVGMDVVAKTVETLRGRIDIDSQLGHGSRFVFRIPLANALTDSLVVSIGGLRYVLRISTIKETFHPNPKSIFHLPDGTEKIKLRDGLYTVVRIGHGKKELDRELFVLLENRGRQIALAIDEVLGKVQSVIKTKPAFLSRAEKLSGYAIIGTGSDDVAWALDLDAIMPMEIDVKRMGF